MKFYFKIQNVSYKPSFKKPTDTKMHDIITDKNINQCYFLCWIFIARKNCDIQKGINFLPYLFFALRYGVRNMLFKIVTFTTAIKKYKDLEI